MKKVLITGAAGLVGSRIVELLDGKYAFIPLSSKDMDITDRDAVHERLSSLTYDAILHLAGYTNVDGAEKEKETAYRINEQGTKNLVEMASSQKKQFIYISTDFVFDGNMPPYVETSDPHPISIYGDSKYKGELAVGKNGMIVRIAYPYRAQFDKKKDIVRILKSVLEAGKPLSMIGDSLMVPTFIDDIAGGLDYLLTQYESTVFHLVGKDALTPFDMAQQIAHTFKLDASLISKTSYDTYFAGKAKRPKKCDIRSIKNTFYAMSSLEEGLTIIKKQLNVI
jgi:dTDP-4-dehydrorhamnose reductase